MRSPQSSLTGETSHLGKTWVWLRHCAFCLRGKRNQGWPDIGPEPPHAHTLTCIGTHTQANMHTQTTDMKVEKGKEEVSWDLYQAGKVTGQFIFLSVPFFWNRVLLCSPSWPQICNPSASASWQLYLLCVCKCMCIHVYVYIHAYTCNVYIGVINVCACVVYMHTHIYMYVYLYNTHV